MTPQDLEAITRVTATAAKAAVAEGNLPLIERLGRIEGTLGMGAQRMDGLDSDITEHARRLDGHDGDHKEHREELAKLRARRADERTPPRNPVLPDGGDTMPWWLRELLSTALRWGVPTVIGLIGYAFAHGAKLPGFG